MDNPITQRIKDYLGHKRWTINQLSKALNISQPTLNRQITEVSSLGSEVLSGMLQLFPDLSAEWLLRGTGPMEGIVPTDTELRDLCINQAREIYRLRQELDSLKATIEKKNLA